jgi:transcriptional regulator with XRE-family HTH domain
MYEVYCKLRDLKGVKDATVSKETDIPKSTFSDWKNGKSKPKMDKLQRIADYFNVSLDYLMNGEETLNFSTEHIELIEMYEKLNTEQKNIVKSLLRTMVSQND